MKPVHSVKNQYRGINAHLQSYLQYETELWTGFHTFFIADLARFLQKQLVPKGYIADIEISVQIRWYDETIGRPRADVLIIDPEAVRASSSSSPVAIAEAEDITIRALPELVRLPDEELIYRAIAIRRAGESPRGNPITRIELLSPSNKPGGSAAAAYLDKRLALLRSGIVFVELDFLHESPPTLEDVAMYRPADKGITTQPGSHPYRIVVIDPRPDVRTGWGRLKEFDVDAPLPEKMTIPLAGKDFIRFDFGALYQRTFEEMF